MIRAVIHLLVKLCFKPALLSQRRLGRALDFRPKPKKSENLGDWRRSDELLLRLERRILSRISGA